MKTNKTANVAVGRSNRDLETKNPDHPKRSGREHLGLVVLLAGREGHGGGRMPEIATSIRFGALCVASLLLLATATRAIGTTTGSREPLSDRGCPTLSPSVLNPE